MMQRFTVKLLHRLPYAVAGLCILVAVVMTVAQFSSPQEELSWIPISVFAYAAWRLIADRSRSWAAILFAVTTLLATVSFHEELFPVICAIAGVALMALIGSIHYHSRPPRAGELSGSQLTEQAFACISVAVSCGCCIVLGIRTTELLTDAIHGRYRDKFVATAAVVAILVVVVLFFMEPTIALLNRLLFSVDVERRRQHRWPARFVVLVFGALTVSLHKLFDDLATDSMTRMSAQDQLLGVLLLMSLLLPGQITGGWIKGVPRQSYRLDTTERRTMAAVLYGAVRALVFALTFVFLLWTAQHSSLSQFLWSLFHPKNDLSIAVVDIPDLWLSPNSGIQRQIVTSLGVLPPWPRIALINALDWILLAFSGGLATRLKKKVLLGISIGLVSTLFLEIAVQHFIFTHFYWMRLAALQLLMIGGWLLGIVIYRPAHVLLSGVNPEICEVDNNPHSSGNQLGLEIRRA